MTSYRFVADAVVFSFTFMLFGVMILGCEFGEVFHHYHFKHFLSILPSLPFVFPSHARATMCNYIIAPHYFLPRLFLCGFFFFGCHVTVEIIPSAENPLKGFFVSVRLILITVVSSCHLLLWLLLPMCSDMVSTFCITALDIKSTSV